MTNLLSDGWTSVKHNREPVLFYLGALFVFGLIVNGLEMWAGITGDAKPDWLPIYQFSATLVQAVLFSILSAVVFARMGEEIDRPLWKCPTDKEAILRFFVLWFILHLLLFTLHQLLGRALEAEQMAAVNLLFTLILILQVLAIPIAACVMYLGRFKWSELGIALRPLTKHIDLSLQALGVALFQFLLWLMVLPNPDTLADMSTVARLLYWPVMLLPMALLDCLLFAMVWRICMVHRDDGVDDLDPFDL